eukprot:1159895-Pelagomonas_calceolata.AAC.11
MLQGATRDRKDIRDVSSEAPEQELSHMKHVRHKGHQGCCKEPDETERTSGALQGATCKPNGSLCTVRRAAPRTLSAAPTRKASKKNRAEHPHAHARSPCRASSSEDSPACSVSPTTKEGKP